MVWTRLSTPSARITTDVPEMYATMRWRCHSPVHSACGVDWGRPGRSFIAVRLRQSVKSKGIEEETIVERFVVFACPRCPCMLRVGWDCVDGRMVWMDEGVSGAILSPVESRK